MPSIRFRLNGVETTVDADPNSLLIELLRGKLGLMAPAGTPKPVIDKLNAAVNDIVKRPDIVKLWSEQGAMPMSMTPQEFDKFLRGDIVKWGDVVKKFERP